MRQTDEGVPYCANCAHGRPVPTTDKVLCPHEGVVSSGYLCKKYTYNLLLKEAKRRRDLPTEDYSEEDFIM